MKDRYKTLIISCWVVLLCCFVVKLLGGNFFEIVCENEKFIRFCEFVETNWLKYPIALITYVLSTFIYMLGVIKKKTTKYDKLQLIFILITFWILKVFLSQYTIVIFIIDALFTIVVPILFNKENWLMSIIGYGLIILFQVISLVIKNIGVKMIDSSTFVSLIFSIDYYIMICLFYLYRTKEEEPNGNFWNRIFRNRRQRKHQ